MTGTVGDHIVSVTLAAAIGFAATGLPTPEDRASYPGLFPAYSHRVAEGLGR